MHNAMHQRDAAKRCSNEMHQRDAANRCSNQMHQRDAAERYSPINIMSTYGPKD